MAPPDGATHAATPVVVPIPSPTAPRRSLSLLGKELPPRVLLIVDFVVLYLAATVAVIVAPHGGSLDHVVAIVYPALVVVLMRRRPRSEREAAESAIDAAVSVTSAVSLAAMLAIALESVTGARHPATIAIRLWVSSVGMLGTTRVLLALCRRRARTRGTFARPTLIIGRGIVAERILHRLQDRPEYGLRPVGFLDAGEWSPVPVLGTPDELAEVAARTGARKVIVAFSTERDQELVHVVRRSHELGLEVSVVPRLYESINRRATLEYIGGLPLLTIAPVEPAGPGFATKQIADRVFAAVALSVLAPLLVCIALAVKLTSPGPALFRQRRVGRGGKTFEILKFRTMTVETGEDVFVPAPGVAPGGVEGADRRTRIGRVLRATSLDELPQLFNVLRGEMSLVGPRPERPEFVAQFAAEVDGYSDRHSVQSGITGWAQVNGLRGPTSIADRAEWDNHYIRNWSPWFDLRILAMTVAEVIWSHVPGRGASSPAPSNVEPAAPAIEAPAGAAVASDKGQTGAHTTTSRNGFQ